MQPFPGDVDLAFCKMLSTGSEIHFAEISRLVGDDLDLLCR